MVTHLDNAGSGRIPHMQKRTSALGEFQQKLCAFVGFGKIKQEGRGDWNVENMQQEVR